MANIDWTDMRWNGKLSWAVDLLYYDKINVDVAQPPYAWRDRNSSFFFKTRKWYRWDSEIKQFLYDCHFVEEDEDFLDRERDIADIKVMRDDTCTKDSWTVYYLCVTRDRSYRTVVTRKIEWWCLTWNFRRTGFSVDRWCACSDERLFTTTYVKWPAQIFLYENLSQEEIDGGATPNVIKDSEWWWIQINRKEWWVVRWYFTDSAVEDWLFSFSVNIWDYIVVYSSENDDDSGFCWQVRTIIWKSPKGELMLNEPWLWFKDILDENWEVRWWWLSYRVYHEYGDVVWITSKYGVEIITDPDDEEDERYDYRWLKMCDFHIGSCIISSTADANRVYFLYENGYIHYWEQGMNKFYSLTDDTVYVWKDKSVITMYRDMLIAFWKRHIAVWLWDSTWNYMQTYNQSVSIWLKNRYAYWEYNWDLLFVSNDNRLLALQFENNVWTHMLWFEDVWAYANPFLKAMLPTDEVYLWVDNNQLRLFINSKTNIEDWGNSRTYILKYDTIFQTRTVDELKYFLIRWCHEWLYFWDDLYYRNGNIDRQVIYNVDEWEYYTIEREYNVFISAYLLENENNWMSNEYGSADLFHLASLQKLIVLLWTWRYTDDLTKIRITEWRWWWWRQYEINCLENNDWVKMIWYAYNGAQLDEEFVKKKKCVIDSLNDGSKQIRVRCEEWHKIQDPVQQLPWCNYLLKSEIGWDEERIDLYQDAQFWEHNVCINDEVYELAPTMPLVLNLWDQENYNSGIKVELISQSWDIINFWWFMAQLHFATLWQYVGWDSEYQITIDTGC